MAEAGTPFTAEEMQFLGIDPTAGPVKPPRKGHADERTQRFYRAMVNGSLSVESAARRLRTTQNDVARRVDTRTIYSFTDEKTGRVCIPEFQFRGRKLVRGIGEVVPSLPTSLHPIEVYGFLTHRDGDFPNQHRKADSAINWLQRRNNPQIVARLAASL